MPIEYRLNVVPNVSIYKRNTVYMWLHQRGRRVLHLWNILGDSIQCLRICCGVILGK